MTTLNHDYPWSWLHLTMTTCGHDDHSSRCVPFLRWSDRPPGSVSWGCWRGPLVSPSCTSASWPRGRAGTVSHHPQPRDTSSRRWRTTAATEKTHWPQWRQQRHGYDVVTAVMMCWQQRHSDNVMTAVAQRRHKLYDVVTAVTMWWQQWHSDDVVTAVIYEVNDHPTHPTWHTLMSQSSTFNHMSIRPHVC